MYSGVGAYVGFSPDAALLSARRERPRARFQHRGTIARVVVTGRGGGWMPPRHTSSAVIGEFGAEIGLRLAIAVTLPRTRRQGAGSGRHQDPRRER